MTQNDTGGECGINGISGPSDTDTIDQDVRPAAVYRTAVPVIASHCRKSLCKNIFTLSSDCGILIINACRPRGDAP